MSVKTQVIASLEEILTKVKDGGYSETKLEGLHSLLTTMDKTETIEEEKDDQWPEDIITYLFRGWFLSKLIENGNLNFDELF